MAVDALIYNKNDAEDHDMDGVQGYHRAENIEM